MNDKRSRPVDEILSDAVDRPFGERRGYVEKECAGDEEALREVLSLLAAYEASDDFMVSPAEFPGGGPDARADNLIGSRVGVYRLVESIGVGGMGVVYLGERDDGEFSQRVAVKLIHHTLMGKEAVRRFRNECRVLAMLEHPNIARMIDGGFADDRTPYIAMEYVNGVPIDRYCNEQDLSVEQRLDLFRAVCAAVQHAHKHSTIHRDIKPSNILVTHDGQPKLVDFGIARVLDVAEDAGERTATGLEMMTPQYASPEQLGGDMLSTSTDVYSLGVVLFKLLTGRLPFTEKGRKALERVILETAPSRPSETVLETGGMTTTADTRRRSRRLRGDLDTIVLMALRKEPERRYTSVEQFSEDIRHHLSGQPVSAQPDTFGYRAGKFLRRNTVAVAAASVLAVVLIASTIVSLTLYNRAEIARREAVQERIVASRERAAAVNTSDFLQELLASVDPSEVDGSMDITVREVLDKASARLETEMADEPEVAAALHFVVGRAYMNLAEHEIGERHLQKSLEMRRGLDPPDEEGIMRALTTIGILYEKQGAFAEAESLLVLALPADIAAGDPGLVSELEATLSRVYSSLSRLEEAESFARRSIASADKIREPAHVMHAQSRGQLGTALFRQGRYAEAEVVLREAVAIAQRTVGGEHVLTGQCYNDHAVVLGTLGRHEESIEQYRSALVVYEAAYPSDHPEFATTHLNLADQYAATKQYDEALQLYQTARDELVAAYGHDHVYISLAINGMGMCYWRTNELEKARVALTDAIQRMVARLGASHPWVATPRNNLGYVYRDLGQRDESERLANEALATMRSNLPEGHHHIARPLGLLAQLNIDVENYRAALAYAQEAADICSAALDEGHADRVAAEERLAECRTALGQ